VVYGGAVGAVTGEDKKCKRFSLIVELLGKPQTLQKILLKG
jgi:hypothetical protein